MKQKYIIPGIIALGLHAALLLGSKSDGENAPAVPDKTRPAADRLEPPVIALDAGSEAPPVPYGVTEAQNITLPDRFQKAEFDRAVIDYLPLKPGPVPLTERILTGPVGRPDGAMLGEIRGLEMLDARMLDAPPRVLAQAPPLYPHEARIRGFEGEVLVAFTVDENGRVITVQVIRSSDPGFESAARQAVGQWRFEPGRRLGRVVRFAMTVPIVFRLHD